MANTWTQEQHNRAISLCGAMGFSLCGGAALELACQRNELLEALKDADHSYSWLLQQARDPHPSIDSTEYIERQQHTARLAIAKAEAVNG